MWKRQIERSFATNEKTIAKLILKPDDAIYSADERNATQGTMP